MESLGYCVNKDDIEHKPTIRYGNSTVRLEPDTLDSLKDRIDTYTRAIIDSELLMLQEKEIKKERLEKEHLVKHLQNRNIYLGSQFGKDRSHLTPQAAHERTDIEVTEEMRKHDDAFFDE